jgi:integrase
MSQRFTRLSRDAIRKLAAGHSISEHGITAERLTSGDVRFSVNIMVNGRRVHRVVGTENEGVTRRQAEEVVEKIRTDARADRLNLPTGRKLVLTLAATTKNYLARLEQSGGKNLKVKRQHLRMHLIPAFGSKTLETISQFDVERYKRDRIAAGAAKATVNRELATLSHLFTTALEWRLIDRLPVRLRRFTEDNGRIITLSDGELDRLLETAIAGPDPQLWLFIEIARATAMRHMEIIRIRWQDCDLVARRIFVAVAKTGSRQQPITQHLADILKRERAMRNDQEGWVFPARRAGSSKGHIKNFEHQFRTAVITAGLDPKIVTPHVLRHTAITKLVQAGVDLFTVMRISGHRSLRMVQRYSHISAPHIDAAIAVLDETSPELHHRSVP